MERNRATRRLKKAQIKNTVWREIEKDKEAWLNRRRILFPGYVQPAYQEKWVRRTLRNEGKYRHYRCRCEGCLQSRRLQGIKESQRADCYDNEA